MSINLNDSIEVLAGVSSKRATHYKRLGIETVGELLKHYPRRYIDFSTSISIAEAGELHRGEYCVVKAVVSKRLAPIFGHTSIFKLQLEDESGTFTCTFFNCEYIYSRLTVGHEYIFYGRISTGRFPPEIINPIYIFPDSLDKLTPKYRLTAGLTHAIISANVKTAMKLLGLEKPPYPAGLFAHDLPQKIRDEYNLMSVDEATVKIHFSASQEENKRAKRSLAFKELLSLQLGLAMLRSRNRKLTGVQAEGYDISDFYKNLPFTPTGAQLRAVEDCVADMKKPIPMNRLLQGDVGSGKTMVAAALARFTHLNGFQTALMVPTEILANQHHKTLTEFLSPFGIKTALVTGGLSAAEKKSCLAEIKSGDAAVVVGTHALIQKGVEFNELGLVITDEQHRFGVGQRSELISKGRNPHTLVMSATPIPRTLGLIIYGDLDISLLDEMPKGRQPIKTYGVDSTYRERLYKFIIKEVTAGRQAYIVCPLVDSDISDTDSENLKKSAVKQYNQLRETWFKEIPTGLLHGKMKQSEKDPIMDGFKSGTIKVLVSTTVIEVGVDVPNATVMLIENAEQFGLSQLHQLRGRVGRGKEQSYCILITDSDSAYTKARVDTMSSTCNGFEIAGKDLELRGPGDFFGQKQHGLPLLRASDLAADGEILSETQALAKLIIKDDPELNDNIELKQLAAELFKDSDEYGFN
ncbi:MAG: ATP-dependent DNA helicase RecG [Oscillospiraceae bacterium]|nr:ATP-dependent DNA helicase RecG [Oscillospiraceae bacterium]